MSDLHFKISIQGDREGFIIFECPYCDSEFKLGAEEFQSDDNEILELTCPYCGLSKNIQSFYNEDVIEAAKAIVQNYMIDEINKSFTKTSRSISKIKSIKMKFKPLKKVKVKDLCEKDTVEEIFQCKYCNNHVKVLYCIGVSKVFCPYCGVDL